MSGTGKSSALAELARRGFRTVDTDEPGWTVEDDEGGPYVLRLSGKDRFGNPVLAERAIMISGSKDVRLRLLSDHVRFRVGEPANINLHSRGRAGTALLAWEADRILKYRLVPTGKDGVVEMMAKKRDKIQDDMRVAYPLALADGSNLGTPARAIRTIGQCRTTGGAESDCCSGSAL